MRGGWCLAAWLLWPGSVLAQPTPHLFVETAMTQPSSPGGLQEPVQGQARFDPSFSHGRLEVDGASIHYVRGRQGTPVILLHGFPQTWWAWHGVMPALARSHTVIALDLPGLGDSTAQEGFDRHTAARRLREAVRQLGIDRYALVAHDIGGMVAYAWARDFRDEVTRVVAMEALLPGFGLEALFDNSQPGQQLWHFAFNAYPALPEKLIAGREADYFAYFSDTQTFRRDAITPEDRAVYVAKYQQPGSLAAGLNYYRSIFPDAVDNRTHVEPKLPMPVLALGGELSVGSNIATSWRQVANDVRLVVVPRCGHFISEEQPSFFLEQVLNFLR